MKFLLHKYLEEDGLDKAADDLGIEYKSVKFDDIYNGDWKDWGFIHGSINSCKALKQQCFDLTPFDRLRCQVYYAYWQDWLFNNQYIILPVQGLIKRWDEIMDLFESYLFVRPDSNDKVFAAQVCHEVDDLKALLDVDFAPEKLVVTSPAYKIEKEWRCFMHRGRVLDSSLYKVDGELDVQNDWTPQIFAETIPQYPGLPPVYVLDICQAGDQKFILEVGGVNVAGLYACDPAKILPAIVAETEELARAEA